MPVPINRDELGRLVARGAQLVEVLPAEEYTEEHLPGAVYDYTTGKVDWLAAGRPTVGPGPQEHRVTPSNITLSYPGPRSVPPPQPCSSASSPETTKETR